LNVLDVYFPRKNLVHLFLTALFSVFHTVDVKSVPEILCLILAREILHLRVFSPFFLSSSLMPLWQHRLLFRGESGTPSFPLFVPHPQVPFFMKPIQGFSISFCFFFPLHASSSLQQMLDRGWVTPLLPPIPRDREFCNLVSKTHVLGCYECLRPPRWFGPPPTERFLFFSSQRFVLPGILVPYGGLTRLPPVKPSLHSLPRLPSCYFFFPGTPAFFHYFFSKLQPSYRFFFFHPPTVIGLCSSGPVSFTFFILEFFLLHFFLPLFFWILPPLKRWRICAYAAWTFLPPHGDQALVPNSTMPPLLFVALRQCKPSFPWTVSPLSFPPSSPLRAS